MNKRIKTKWLKALRSGKYKQGKGGLAKPNRLGNIKHCCLGVLCDIYLKEHKQKWNPINKEDDEKLLSIGRSRETALLPPNVTLWAGLKEDNPILKSTHESLAGLNDAGLTFKELAKRIEEEL
jgi:hypothetical protein